MYQSNKRELIRFVKKRFNTLHDRKKPATGSIAAQRYRLGPQNPVENKIGYEFIERGTPVYEYSTLITLKETFRLIGPVLMGKKVNELGRSIYSLQQLEHKLAEEMEEVETDDFTRRIHLSPDYGEWNMADPFSQVKDEDKAVILYQYNHTCPGCIFMDKAFEKKDKWMIIGLALMEKLLGVCTYYQCEDMDSVDEQIEMFREMENERGEPVNLTNWKDCPDEVITFSYGTELKLGELAEDLRFLEEKERELIVTFDSVLRNLDYKKLGERMWQNDYTALWLRSIIWLAINGFNLGDYSYASEYEMHTQRSYVMYWNESPFLNFVDETINTYNDSVSHGSMCYPIHCTVGQIANLKGKDHFLKIKLFHHLFLFNYQHNRFDYGEKDQRMVSEIGALNLPQWERILHRAIRRRLSKLPPRLEAAG